MEFRYDEDKDRTIKDYNGLIQNIGKRGYLKLKNMARISGTITKYKAVDINRTIDFKYDNKHSDGCTHCSISKYDLENDDFIEYIEIAEV